MWRLKSAEGIYKTWLQNIKLVLIMFCIIWEDQFLSFDKFNTLKDEPHIVPENCQAWNPNKG